MKMRYISSVMYHLILKCFFKVNLAHVHRQHLKQQQTYLPHLKAQPLPERLQRPQQEEIHGNQ